MPFRYPILWGRFQHHAHDFPEWDAHLLAFNYNHRNKNVRLYELGNIYLPGELPVAELPDERMQFTLGMYGEGDFL